MHTTHPTTCPQHRALASAVFFATCLTLPLHAGCDPDFAPYNKVVGLRVLAIKAEHPSLKPGHRTELSALVTEPEAELRWSWCPLTTGASNGLECLLTERELAFFAQAGMGLPSLQLPKDPETQNAHFEHPFEPGQLQDLCVILLQAVQSQLGNSVQGVEVPTCSDDTLMVQIRLEAQYKQQKVVAVRDLALRVNDNAATNSNPSIAKLEVVPEAGETPQPLAMVPLRRGQEYEFKLTVPADSVEKYPDQGQPRSEDLTASWYFEAGEFDKNRTGFREGETDLANLGRNHWATPSADEWQESEARLWIVLRDGRGGIAWIEDTASLDGSP